jgi:hypothetical protein
VTEVEVVSVHVAGGLELLASLERLGAATATSLDLPADLPYERYVAVGMALGRGHRDITWKIGDWLNYGEFTYRKKYSQAAEILNMQPQTLMNYARTARAVSRERRRPELPFSVHSLVAPLEPEQQTRWLDQAVEQHWKREELDAELHPPPPLELPPEVATPEEIEQAARDLIRSGRPAGENYLVGRASFKELAALLGEPES